MPQLDNLLSKIEANGESSAQEIVKKAEDEAALLLEKTKEEANAKKSDIIEAAKGEATHVKETILSGKRLAVRDDKLAAKQKVIDQVFSKAITIMSSMSMEEFTEFVEKSLKQSHSGEKGELKVPEKFSSMDIDAINEATEMTLTLSDEAVSNGFVFVSEGVEYNNTFDALLEFTRDDLELFVSNELF